MEEAPGTEPGGSPAPRADRSAPDLGCVACRREPNDEFRPTPRSYPATGRGRSAVMPHESSTRDARVLVRGLGIGESPRWHDGRLWFSIWGTNDIVAVDLNGNSEVMGRGGGGSGWAANWLRDGRTLITGNELIRVEPDGSRVRARRPESHLAVRLERAHRRRARQHLHQHDQFRLRGLQRHPGERGGTGEDRARHA